MATDPNAAPQDDAAGADDESGADESDMSQGFVIELTVKGDGTITVSGPEPVQEEAEEENASGEGSSEESGQTCQSIGEALKAVLSIYKEASAGSSEDDQMSAGFNSVRGGA